MIFQDFDPNFHPCWPKPLQWAYPYQSPSYPGWLPMPTWSMTVKTVYNIPAKKEPDPKLAIRAKDV